MMIGEGRKTHDVSAAYGRPRGFRQWLSPRVWAAALLLCAALTGPASARTLHIVALGDSLTAGFLLPADAAFPAVLERALKAKGFDVHIDNAGVSGDTSTDAQARLDWSIGDGADGVILEIGANDMLRGLDPKIPRDAIAAMLATLRERKIPVLLTSMRAAPNLGADYVGRFNAIYADLAEKYGATLAPFFLEGVAGHPDQQLSDGLHPNRKGVETIVANLTPAVASWLEKIRAGAAQQAKP